MTCKDCVKYNGCKADSETNEYMRKKMWQLDFWENAEKRCKGFKEKDAKNLREGVEN